MAHFNLHFFKEKSRKIDVEALIDYFESIEGFTVKPSEEQVLIKYLHPRLNYEAKFVITPKSTVPDIYRLDPRYLDLNFQLSFQLITPYYVADHIFEIVKKLVTLFDFYVYNEMFENVLPFKIEVTMKAFEMLKEAYIKKNPIFLSDYYRIGRNKSNAVFRYLDDQGELLNYYKELNTYVPNIHVLLTNKKEYKLAIEWKENTLTVFPPYIDYIFYNRNNEIEVIDFEEFFTKTEKYLSDVPGFIKETKVINRKQGKKINRIMRKAKFSKIHFQYEKQNLKRLLD